MDTASIHPGDCIEVAALPHILCPVWGDDNMGPPDFSEVLKRFADLRSHFKSHGDEVRVVASTFDAFARLVHDGGFIERLPVVDNEVPIHLLTSLLLQSAFRPHKI